MRSRGAVPPKPLLVEDGAIARSGRDEQPPGFQPWRLGQEIACELEEPAVLAGPARRVLVGGAEGERAQRAQTRVALAADHCGQARRPADVADTRRTAVAGTGDLDADEVAPPRERLAAGGPRRRARLIAEDGRRRVRGRLLPSLDRVGRHRLLDPGDA